MEEENMVEVVYRQGQKIEVGSSEVGFKGSWYGATVLHSSNTPSRSASKIMKKVFVQYQTLMKDEHGSNPLTEYIPISRVRPRPPPSDDDEEEEEDKIRSFEVDEEVEAFYNDGWWEGNIMQVLENKKYRVFFRDSNDVIEFHQSEIRRQRNWISGRWVKAQKVQEVPVTPQDQSQIRSPRPIQSSQARRNLSKVKNQSTPKQANSASSTIGSSKKKKKKKMQSSPNSDSGFLRPSKKLKTAEEIKTPLSLMACPMRGMSSGTLTEVDGGYDFTTSTIKGKRTKVARKRKHFRDLAAICLDLLSEVYSKDHPKPLDSYHKKPKHALESNGSGDHPSIQGCSSQLPPKTIEVPQYKLVGRPKPKHALESNGSGDHPSVQGCSSQLPLKTIEAPEYKLVGRPKTKMLVQRKPKLKARPRRREKKPLGGNDMKLQKMEGGSIQTIDVCNRKRQTTTKDSSTKAAVKGGKHKGARGRSQAPAAHTQTQTIGPEQTTTPSNETTIVVYREDTSKETEKDGASSEISDLHQPLSMLLQESCLKGLVQRHKKLTVRPRRRKGKPLGGDNMKLQIMEGGSNQMIGVFNKGKQTTAKDSSTKTAVEGSKHNKARGRLLAPAAQTQTQTIGPEQMEPSKETTIVVHREVTLRETKTGGASSDIRDLHQPMLLQESCLPPIIGEKGVSSDNQPTVQSVKSINWKDAPTRGLELQKKPNVVESSFSLEYLTADTELNVVAVRDEYNDMHLSLPFVKRSPLWEFVESLEVFRSMPQQLHFHPLEEYNMELREGLAIGCMLNFANLVENMRKSQIEEPLSQLQDWSKVLDDLVGHGFNVQPVRARLKELIRLKGKYEHFVGKIMFVKEQIRVKKDEKEQLAARLVEVDKEIRDRAEIINQLKKQFESIRIENELHDSKFDKLMTTRHQSREGIRSIELKFDICAAAPW